MEESTPDHSMKLSKLLVCLCHRFWNIQKLFWSTIGVGLLLNIGAVFLFFRWPWSANPKIAENGSIIWWLLQHPVIVSLAGLLLLSLAGITFAGSRFSCHDGSTTEQNGKSNAQTVESSGKRSVAFIGTQIGNITTGDVHNDPENRE